MKWSKLLFTKKASVVLIATCLISSIISFTEMSVAQAPRKFTFKCQSSQGVYKTVLVNAVSGKRTDFIVWNSGGLGNYPDNVRCALVTDRLQRLSSLGQLEYFVNGIVNDENVICGVASKKEGCFEHNLVYTLHAGVDPMKKVEKLTGVAIGLVRSPMFETGGRVYLDVKKYLDLLDSSEIKPDQILSM
jgi:hypothetical protein